MKFKLFGEQLIILFIIIQYIQADVRNQFEIQSLTCNFNDNYYKDARCSFHKNNKDEKFVSGHVRLLKPLDTLMVNVKIFWETDNGVQKKLIDMTEDFCQFTNGKTTTMLMAIIFPLLEHNANIPKKCPIDADFYYLNNTAYENMAKNNFPVLMPDGIYNIEAKATYKDDVLAEIKSKLSIKHAA